MDFIKWVRDGMASRRVAVYLKVVAVFALMGALSHLGSIMGLMGSWVDKPLQFRIGDPLLLLVNLVVAWGLWRTRFWAVVVWVVALVLLQAVPFLLFTEAFAPGPRERMMMYGVLAIDALWLGGFFLLLPRKKRS